MHLLLKKIFVVKILIKLVLLQPFVDMLDRFAVHTDDIRSNNLIDLTRLKSI